jgi:hypothetical protein
MLIIFALVSSGCATATKVNYDIISEPTHAPVDVNGVNMGTTPTKATLECSKKWVGVMNSPDGWVNASGKYEVKAYPPKGFNGQSQTKYIDPCQWKGKGNPSIQFDLGLEKVTPTQKIEITTKNSSDGPSVQKQLDALKTLRNSGVITEEEYKAKVLELVK